MNSNVMNDQFGMEDLLEQEKYLIHSYGTYLPEASEPQLRSVLSDNFNGCLTDQFNVFTKMEEKGWFNGQAAQQNAIVNAKQRFGQMQGQLG